MNVVDSSAWLEYLADGENADLFEAAVEDTGALIVPTLSLYEVYKVVCRQRSRDDALRAVATMHQGQVVDLTPEVAIAAAQLSLQHKLPMADSVILATARAYGALLWTQDEDFEGLEGVRYVRKVYPPRIV